MLVASRNAKKLAELRRVLDEAGYRGIELVGLDEVPPFEEAPETGATFEDNALAKARDGAAATGLPCVADDSGLEVDALNGMPGVLSARWSGAHGDDAANTALVLAQLGDVPDERRGAAFVSACALVSPAAGRPWCAASGPATSCKSRAAAAGSVTTRCSCRGGGPHRRGTQLQEKDAASHRGRALAQLVPALRELAGRRAEDMHEVLVKTQFRRSLFCNTSIASLYSGRFQNPECPQIGAWPYETFATCTSCSRQSTICRLCSVMGVTSSLSTNIQPPIGSVGAQRFSDLPVFLEFE